MFGLDRCITSYAERHSKNFCRVLSKSLKPKGESILIISDSGEKGNSLSSVLGYGYYLAAKKKSLDANLLFQEVKKGFMLADDHILSSIKKLEKNSIIIVAVSNKLGRLDDNKSFRNYCRAKGHRFISATGLSSVGSNHYDYFLEAMNVNHRSMAKKGLAIKKIWDRAQEIRVKTAAGTDLTFDVSGMEAVANIGLYHQPGCGGNMPAGEVYIPPKGNYGVRGTAVIDGSIKTEDGALLVQEPLKLHIEEGHVVSIEGLHSPLLESVLKKYEDRIKYPSRIRQVGELGIGINPKAVLMGLMLLDEKVLGTGHIALGSNYWFGGSIKTVYHGDQVFKAPVFYVDGKKMEL